MVAGDTRNAEPMVAASKPRIVCRMSGARMPGSIAGWAQANISERRWSGMDGGPERELVGQLVGQFLGEFLGEKLQMGDGGLAAVAPPYRVDRAAPRDGEQPAFGIVGNAAPIPVGERGGEGVGERILGARDIAAARGEEGHQLAVAAARHRLRGGARGLSRHRQTYAIPTWSRPAAPRLRRSSRRGSGPPRTAPRRDRARRSYNSRRAAPWFRHKDRRAPWTCRR